jgi:type II secretory pathway predicted ATPase ExeA
MFERHYQLSGPPFGLTPPEHGFFDSASHGKALSYLRYGLQQGEGFIVITGPIGSGKSTVVNRLFAELDADTLDAARICTTQLQAGAALRLILNAFGLPCRSGDKGALLRELERFLQERHRAGRRVLLVIDEAQNLPPRTLEEIRMLSNLSVGGRSLLQTFLVGQPQFQRVLAHPGMEQFRQRVIGWCHLEPMSPDEVVAYVHHRLTLVGWQGRPHITEAALHRLHAETGGIPRLVNQLCNRLLLLGALETLDTLDLAQAEEVVRDLAGEVNAAVADQIDTPSLPGPTAAADSETRREIARLRRTVDSHHEVLARLVRLVGMGVRPAAAGGATLSVVGGSDA